MKNSHGQAEGGIAINPALIAKVFRYYKLLADRDVRQIMQRAEWIYQGRENLIQVSKGENVQDIKNYNDILNELDKLGIMVPKNATQIRIVHFTYNLVLMQKMNELAVEFLYRLYPDKKIENAELEMFKLMKLLTTTHLEIINCLKDGSLYVAQISDKIAKEYFHTSVKINELASVGVVERTKGQIADDFGKLKDNDRHHFYKQNDILVKLVSDYLNNANDILKKYRIPKNEE